MKLKPFYLYPIFIFFILYPYILAGYETLNNFSSISIKTKNLEVVFNKDPWNLEFKEINGKTILKEVAPLKPSLLDPYQRYGTLGYSFNIPFKETYPYEGYYFYVGKETTWYHAVKIISATPISQGYDIIVSTNDKEGKKLHIKAQIYNDFIIKIDVKVEPNDKVNRIAQTFIAPSTEHYFGFGERFNSVVQTCNKVPSWSEEGGFGLSPSVINTSDNNQNPYPNGPLMTNFPIPILISNLGYGIWLDTSFRSVFDLKTDFKDMWRFEVESDRFTYYFIYGKTPKEIVSAYTSLTGRSPLPPPWVFAPWNDAYGGEEEVYKRADSLEKNKIPSQVIWFEDWAGFDYQPSSRYPNIEKLIANLHSRGFKAQGYFKPYFRVNTPEFEEGAKKDYLVKDKNGNIYLVNIINHKFGIPDFTKPEVVVWYKELLRRAVRLGFDGWMYDFGEYTPPDSYFANGMTGREMHNIFPLIAQKICYEMWQEERPNGDYTFYPRAGYSGSQKYITSSWPGDQNTNWSKIDGFPAAITGGINIGLSGIPFWGSDIAGYHSTFNPNTTKELFFRWAEFGALSPIMRTHHGWEVGENWSYDSDEETINFYRFYATLHTSLFPYFYTFAKEATQTGLPLIRHLYLEYPNDPLTYGISDQYMLGDKILVAPVVNPGVSSRIVYLPEGNWINFWTNQTFSGNKFIKVSAPLDIIPLFIKEGSIVPINFRDPNPFNSEEGWGLNELVSNEKIGFYYYPYGKSQFEVYDGTLFSAIDNRGISGKITCSIKNTNKKVAILIFAPPPLNITFSNGTILEYYPSLTELQNSQTGWTLSSNKILIKVKVENNLELVLNYK